MIRIWKWFSLFLGISWLFQGCGLPHYQHSLEPVLSAEEYHDLGVAYEAGKEYQFALDSYKRALELDEDYVAAWIHLGNTYTKTRSYREAEDAYDQALKRDADSVEARNNLAWLYIEQQTKLEDALALVNECAETPSAYQAYCLDTSAMAHFYNGSPDRALETLERAVRATPPENSLLLSQEHYHFGLLYQELREKSEAMQHFQHTIRLAPDSEWAKKSQKELQNM
jgi:tetratricopeptide (TPR) repeat protein